MPSCDVSVERDATPATGATSVQFHPLHVRATALCEGRQRALDRRRGVAKFPALERPKAVRAILDSSVGRAGDC